jgi:hypothetical protein
LFKVLVIKSFTSLQIDTSSFQKFCSSLRIVPTMMPISKIHRALVVLVTVGLMPMVSMSQTSPDIGAAQRQAGILQRQEQERLQREQDEIRRRNNPVDGLDTRQLQPKIEVPELGVIVASRMIALTQNGIRCSWPERSCGS